MPPFPIDPQSFCETLKLSCVRKQGEMYLVGCKDRNGTITEIPFESVANSETYRGAPIVRSYASGHVFIDSSQKQVYLLTIEKDGKIQHQFTGGTPLEEVNREVFFQIDGVVRVRLDAAEDNAELRTYNRTGVQVRDTYNPIPLVDWVLMESLDPQKQPFWKLVCLMHYVVKEFDGVLLPQEGVEQVSDGSWYTIEDLPHLPNIAPNAYIVAKKAQEILQSAR